MKDEIIIYQADQISKRIEVRINNETVWLSIEQIGTLFGRDRTVVNRHINNIFKEGELKKEEVCAFFAHTTQHGAVKEKTQTQNLEYFNLDVIISVGYRVKSKQGTQFRIWANKILKDYLLKGYALNTRMNRMEDNFDRLAKRIDEIDMLINSGMPQNQGIFFDGQVFDAYVFVSDLIRKAQKSIILIDNYIDENILLMLSKRQKEVNVIIYSSALTKEINLDLKKYRLQYPDIKINQFNKSHDRFIIIDRKTIYHIGASLKDLGKKWFAFSILNLEVDEILKKLSENN
ncbi:MAG: RhuM-like protein [Bacteroidetes bacterium]|nr:RhuM-like protein [Bacteroidota bacterium]